MKVKLLSRVRLFATPWTAAYQAPPSMGFSRHYKPLNLCYFVIVAQTDKGTSWSHVNGIIQYLTFCDWLISLRIVHSCCSTVPESGVWLLAAQKSIKKKGWWKGKFALFWMSAIGVVSGGA